MRTSNIRFDFFSDRLDFIRVSNDKRINKDLWLYMRIFESHIFGVVMQYNRINDDLKISEHMNFQNFSIHRAGLDIYYYTMTWDKLRKIFKKISTEIDKIQKPPSTIPDSFISDFKLLKKRIDHLFSEFDTGIRNEYEHPSLEAFSKGNFIMWGNIYSDNIGNIKAQVGKNLFAQIKEEHCKKIQNLRIELFDLFIKHFSRKPLTKELIKERDYYEENVDSLVDKLNKFREMHDTVGFNNLLSEFTMSNRLLLKESVQLSQSVKEKFYSAIFPSKNLDNKKSHSKRMINKIRKFFNLIN